MVEAHPRNLPPAPAVMAILARFDRAALEAFIAVAIDLADAMDGDPDVECNGDELDFNAAEDDFCDHNQSWLGEPGCPIADPDSAIDDGPCDDIGMDLEEDEALCPDYALDQSEALPSAMVIQHDAQGIRQHRDRIRRTRCDKVTRFGWREFVLREDET